MANRDTLGLLSCDQESRAAVRGFPQVMVMVMVILPISSACQPEPLTSDERELVNQFIGLAACIAANNDVVTDLPATGSLPAYVGEVRPPAAVACGRTLNETGRVHMYSGSEHCNAGTTGAYACVSQSFGGCDDRMFLNTEHFPEFMLDYSPLGSPIKDGTPLTFAMTIYHEAVHTVQSDRYRDCPAAMEVEAYDQQLRADSWLTLAPHLGPRGQLRLIVQEVGNAEDVMGLPHQAPVCNTFNEAIAAGLSPCMVDWINTHFPGLDFDDPLSAESCLAVDRLIRYNDGPDPGVQVSAQRGTSAACLVGGASEELTVYSDESGLTTAVDAGGIVYQYFVGEDGVPDLVYSFSLGLDEVLDVSIIKDASGAEVLFVAGMKAGDASFTVHQDSQVGEFYTPPDGVFDGVATSFSDARLRRPSQIVDAGSQPAMIWDKDAQLAVRVTYDAGGVPDGLSPTINLRVPVGLYGAVLEHHPTNAEAYVTPDRAAPMDATVYRFEVLLNDIYSPMETLDVMESSLVPPGFLDVPTHGSVELRVDGPVGHTVKVYRVDATGSVVDTLGYGGIGHAGDALVSLSPSLATGQFVRVVDMTSGGQSRAIPVLATTHPRAHHVSPAYGPTTGGTRIRLRGSGFSQILGVEFDGLSAASVTVVDDRTMVVETPAAPEGTALIEAVTSSGTQILGSHIFQNGTNSFVERFDGARLDTEWSTFGSGWSCGSSLHSDLPSSGDPAGCRFQGATGQWGGLVSPTISLPQGQHQPPLELLLHHQGDFGDDGDGVVLLASDGTDVQTLLPKARPSARVHAAVCSGSGSGRTCAPDSLIAGLHGYSGSAMPRVWRTDIFELPPEFSVSGELTLFLGSTNMSGQDGADYGVSFVEIRDAIVQVGDESNWTYIVGVGGNCSGVYPGGDFECEVLGTDTVFRYHDAASSSSSGYVYIPMPLDGLAGRQVSVRLRHAVGFTSGTSVGTGAGRVRVWCPASQGIVEPLGGYPAVPPGVAPGYTDEGPENGYYWATEEFDVSSFAGESGCWLDLLGSGQADPGMVGWVVDSVEARWR